MGDGQELQVFTSRIIAPVDLGGAPGLMLLAQEPGESWRGGGGGLMWCLGRMRCRGKLHSDPFGVLEWLCLIGVLCLNF